MKVRCIDRDRPYFTFGKSYELVLESAKLFRIVDDTGHGGWYSKQSFEPIPDEPEAPAELPKVDKYEEHRLREGAMMAAEMEAADHDSGATARLLRGLEGEKVRERVMAFPKQGRNFELNGKR